MNWAIRKAPSIVIAYHGCDESISKKVIAGYDRLQNSVNSYDWLGHGQYFWEDNPDRAYEWAVELSKRKKSKIKTPSVVGAIIDLGMCLNLVNSTHIKLVKAAYENLRQQYEMTDKPLPENKDTPRNADLLLRYLDCAVIERLHIIAKEQLGIEFDTVRGVFTEGMPLYDNAGFKEKTHIQLSVVNPNCILGYFKPFDVQ